ncbi:hypothetical protein LZ016_09710 [Sphingomonas sp. SM33]|uniref:Uncharacterized protein n=1 Tax=Sphingomonas telluris TaxID=2907998 RepID=A0ABS9VN29_9SPHN|nr:hypothetical protein [Sphingomonas telluris]MCH8616373.1 hypothetical protein [Sphingomonas telluris]
MVFLAIALLLAGPVYLTAGHVIEKVRGPEQIIHPENDQLIVLRDGTTLHVREGSSGRRIADWLELDVQGQKSFEVGNENFAPNSATLTHDGWQHVAQFAQMLEAHPGVSAVVLYSARHGNPATVKLEHLRAGLIHDEALRQGVHGEQIAVAEETFEATHNTASDEGLEVVLTNKG